MASGISGRTSLSPMVVAIIVAVALLIVIIVGWKTVIHPSEPEKVSVDSNKVKELLQTGGFGHKKN